MDEVVTVTCEKCGQLLRLGDYPFCPHGRSGTVLVKDEHPGGVTYENYGPHPVTFYSESERRVYMKQHGLQPLEKFCPTPGTDKDPAGIPNPKGYMDAVTMENARILLSRVQPRHEEALPVEMITSDVVEFDKDEDVGAMTEEDYGRRALRTDRRSGDAGAGGDSSGTAGSATVGESGGVRGAP